MIAIPAMDLLDGQAVRLERGDYSRVTVYSEDPRSSAAEIAAAGIARMHLVDLGAARTGEWPQGGIVESIAATPGLDLSYGGGIRSGESVDRALDAGVRWVVIGSYAVREPHNLAEDLQRRGPDRFIIAADSLHGRIRTDGWEADGGIGLREFIDHWYGCGVRRFLCTDITRDGMMTGPAVDLYVELQEQFGDAEIIASGGVSGVKDLQDLARAGVRAAVVGKAYWSGLISLDQMGEL